MRVCSYCGKENVPEAEFCSGCGCGLTIAEREHCKTPLSPAVGSIVGLVVLWFPFLIAAALSGDRDVYRSIFVLPGIWFAGGSLVGAAIISVVISMAMGCLVGFGCARSPRWVLPIVAIEFVGSCVLAAFTVMGMLV